MLKGLRFAAVALALAACSTIPSLSAQAEEPYLAEGLVRVQSAYGFDETVERLRADVAAKGIMEFAVVPQSELGRAAGVELASSTLLFFGNPPLGTLFLQSNPNSGIDWPVRLLVYEDADGTVWAVYSDFQYLEARHGIADRGDAFDMASSVIESITSSVRAASATN